jgi:hypothetical protein
LAAAIRTLAPRFGVDRNDNGKGKPVWWRYCHSQQNASAKLRDANQKSLSHFENAAKKCRDL